MAYPYLLSVKEALVQIWNTKNKPKVPLQPNEVDIASVLLELYQDCNSKLTFTVRPSSMYFRGSLVLRYNRIRIDDVCRNVYIPGVAASYPDNHAVLAKLREVYGLMIMDEDIDWAPVTPGSATLRLTPKVDSPTFLFTYSVDVPFQFV